jgi:hypothetical protein
MTPSDPNDNWMRDLHPSLGEPIDPDREERRDGRISDAIGYGALFVAVLVVVGLVAIAVWALT